MSQTITYHVPDMSCGHCEVAIKSEVTQVAGVDSVDVDLDDKIVQVTGRQVDDDAVIAAIDEAGYEAVRGAAAGP